MANGKITKKDLVDDKVFDIGKEYSKALDPAIKANKEWLESFAPIKKAALEYAKIEKQFKVSKGRKEFLQIKEAEEKLRKRSADALKAEHNAQIALNKIKVEEQRVRKQSADAARAEERSKQSLINTEKKQLDVQAKKQRAANSEIAASKKKERAAKTQARSAERQAKQDARQAENQRILARNAREYAVISSKLSTEYEKQSKILIRLQREYKDVALRYGQNSKEAKKLHKEVTKLDRKLKDVDAAAGQHTRTVGNYGTAWKGVGNIMRTAVAAFGIFSAIEIGKQIYGQIKEINALNKALKQVTETQQHYTQAQGFIISLGKETGVQINELQKSYVKFYAAAKTTNLTLRETQDIFRQTAKAGAILGLSTEDTNGALRALEQMLSKGKVQAEEIRGQLGERLPGAFQILARSMGLTTAELSKQLELGNVYAEEVLPKFAKELEKTYSLDKLDRVETLNAAQGRLSNAWMEFIRSMENGEGAISKTLTTLLDGLASAVNLLKFINDSESVVQNEVYTKSLKEHEDYYTKIAEFQKKADIERRVEVEGIINLEKIRSEVTQKGMDEAAKEAAVILKESNTKIKALEAESEALKKQSAELTRRKNSEEDEWFGDLGAIAAAERGLEKNLEKLRKINETLGFQKGARDASLALIKEIEDAEKEKNKTIDDGRRTLSDVLADITAAQKALKDSTEDEAGAILNTIDALNKEKEAWERKTKSVKEASDAALELARFELEQRIAAQEDISGDDNQSFDARFAAIKKQSELEIELARLNTTAKLEELENYSEEALAELEENGKLSQATIERLSAEELLILKKYQAKKDEITGQKEEGEDSLELERIKTEAEKEKDIRETAMNDEIRMENEAFNRKEGIYSKLEDAAENHERRVAEIKKRYAIEGLNAQLAAVQQLLTATELSSAQRVEYERQVAEIKRKISDLTTDHFVENDEKQIISAEEKVGQILEISEALAGALTDLTNAIYEARIENINQEIEKNNEKYERWLENENLTEEQRIEIEKKRQQREDELEKKKRKEQRKQAILDKAMAVVNIGINTAMGIMQAYAQLGPIGGSVGAALVAVLGTIQTAAVLATPIPKYAKGTDNHFGGFALVGEERPEVISEPGKDPYVVNKPTVMDLPKGTRVTPSLDEYKRLMRASVLTSIDAENRKLNEFQASKNFDDHNMVEEIKLLRRAYEKNKTKVIVNTKQVDFEHELFRLKNTNWS